MLWRISIGAFLVQGRLYPIHLAASWERVRLPDGSLVNSACEYFRVSDRGAVLTHYGPPWTTTIEDMLCVSGIHVVLGSSLYECYWEQRCFHDGELTHRVCLPNLSAVSADELPFSAEAMIERFHSAGELEG